MKPLARISNLLAIASGFLLYLAGTAPCLAEGEIFPTGNVFRPLIADPVEPRFFISYLKLRTNAPSDQHVRVASVGFGGDFGFYRSPGEAAGDGWQVGFFGSAFSQFNMSATDDLFNTDYRVGLPLTYKYGSFSTRARLYHQSSHLGDESILGGHAPERVDLSYEAVDLVLAWDVGNWRAYGGGVHLVHVSPGSLKRNGLQAGVDYASKTPFLLGGRLVGGIDAKWYDEMNWHTGVSAKIGLEFGKPRPERRGVTALIEGFHGPAPFGQYFSTQTNYWGVALQFDM